MSEVKTFPAKAGDATLSAWQQRLEAEKRAKHSGQMELAIWPESKRAMPFAFVESALFAPIHPKNTKIVKDQVLASGETFSITYSGEILSQFDADVWKGVMHLARGTRDDGLVFFKARDLLKLIGRHTGKEQRSQLFRSLKRLQWTQVVIFDMAQQQRYFGSLLPEGAQKLEQEDQMYSVTINKRLVRLFDDGVRYIDWQARLKLQKKPLALWLQTYFSGRKPEPVKVADLWRISGKTFSQKKHFTEKLKQALKVLETDEVGVIHSWRIDALDMLHVVPMDDEKRTARKRERLLSTKAQQELSLLPGVSSEARAEFSALYGEAAFDPCLQAWLDWLKAKGYSAKSPDRAFLGFAKKWAASLASRSDS